MYHGITLIIIGFNADKLNFNLRWPIRLLFTGVVFFSGSIYFLAIQPLLNMNFKFLGPVTPIGGGLMITAWVLIIFRLINDRQMSE